MSQYKINLATRDQVVLFECELTGQISDGYWENARPADHWKKPCDADVSVTDDKPSINFYPYRKYNFAAKPLLDCVSERMRDYVLLSRAVPELSLEAIRNFHGVWFCDSINPYYNLIIAEYRATLGVNSYEEFSAWIEENLDKNSYTLKDLKKDLKAINEAFKNIIYF